MSENILSIEDLKFLESLYFKNGLQSLRLDDHGLAAELKNELHNNEQKSFLSEITKKLKYRLGSNFEMNFRNGFNLDVVRI